MSFASLLIHKVNIHRKSDLLFKDQTFPLNIDVFSQSGWILQSDALGLGTILASQPPIITDSPVLVEVSAAGITTVSVDVSGLVNNVATTETIILDSATPVKLSNTEFDTLTNITVSASQPGMLTAKLRNSMGQPSVYEVLVAEKLKARISPRSSGRLNNVVIEVVGDVRKDLFTMFINIGPQILKIDDRVVDLDTKKEYTITSVHEIFSSNFYHHTESSIEVRS